MEEDGTGRVKIVSADAALRIKASQLGLVAEDYHRPARAATPSACGAGTRSTPTGS